MTAFPKDPPIIDPGLMKRLHAAIHRCEWPGNPCQRRERLEVAHIKARGMGGGKRKDTIANLVVLCSYHHRVYDQEMGQSWKNQQFMRQALDRRRPEEWSLIGV